MSIIEKPCFKCVFYEGGDGGLHGQTCSRVVTLIGGHVCHQSTGVSFANVHSQSTTFPTVLHTRHSSFAITGHLSGKTIGFKS